MINYLPCQTLNNLMGSNYCVVDGQNLQTCQIGEEIIVFWMDKIFMNGR